MTYSCFFRRGRWLMVIGTGLLVGCTSNNAIDRATKASAASAAAMLREAPVSRLAPLASLQNLLDEGLKKQDALFDGRAAVIEATLLRQAHGWSRLPQVVPSISFDDAGDPTGQVSADLTLIDWGKSGGEKQTLDARLLRARMDLWREHNVFLQGVLEDLLKAAAAQSRVDLISRHLVVNEGLQSLVEGRVAAGIGEAAELPLVALRVQELRRNSAVEGSQRAAQLAILAQITGLNRSNLPNLDLEDLLTAVGQRPSATTPPSLQIARTEVLIADGVIRTALAGRLPAIVLSGVAAVVGSGSSGVSLGSGGKSFTDALTQTDTKLARSAAVVAMARLQAEEEALEQNTALFTLKEQELKVRIKTIAEQITISRGAVATFDQQFQIGARPITDAVQVHERLYEGERLLIDAKYELALLLVERLAETGALARQPAITLGKAPS